MNNGETLTLYKIFDIDGKAEVSSLSEYIWLIEQLNHNKNMAKVIYQEMHQGAIDIPYDYAEIEQLLNSEYIFRGETRDFEETITTASAFREEIKYSLYPDFRIARDEYYRAVGHKLNEIERNNFTAFAQHHGLVTNLLDVTYASLTALFMG